MTAAFAPSGALPERIHPEESTVKSKSIILSTLMAALIGMGCGGSPTEPQAPMQPESGAGSGTPAATEGTGAEGTGAEGAGTEGEGAAAGEPSATAPGPQITPAGVVRFNYQPPGRVKKIYLAGNFNGWNPSNGEYLLSDEDGDGIYSITINLEPGTYQYKFVIDSRWTKDPHAPGSHPDGFGGQNGKFEVPAK
jgi:Glycogen recognition site of AMP-activated protein kinase